MPKEPQKFPDEPAEGSREVIDHELARPDGGNANHGETGVNKFLKGESRRPDAIHNGDKGDEPKEPYGLTEAADEQGSRSRHYDGQAMRKTDKRE